MSMQAHITGKLSNGLDLDVKLTEPDEETVRAKAQEFIEANEMLGLDPASVTVEVAPEPRFPGYGVMEDISDTLHDRNAGAGSYTREVYDQALKLYDLDTIWDVHIGPMIDAIDSALEDEGHYERAREIIEADGREAIYPQETGQP